MSESSYHWTCPFCDRDTVITDRSVLNGSTNMLIDNAQGHMRFNVQFVICPNRECNKFTLNASLNEYTVDVIGRPTNGDLLESWNLIPTSKAQSFPEYIPKAIRDDYNEACLILKLSPKASATLSRRCLQGILRDYWEVKPANLKNEIEQIKDKVDTLTWEAIEAVRTVGNIGAHMEKDINLIIDVEPQEADLLVGLIETLLRDWYIVREKRKERLENIKKVAIVKEQKKKPNQLEP